jgi:hypothetical protein
VVVVVEIFRRNFLASMVPVIVDAILNEHQLVIDIVAFVIKGDFHRSRLGEKQRGKILAGWVTRKMRTIAQYSIRDGGMDNIYEGAEPPGRHSSSTFRHSTSGGPGSMKGSMRGGSTLGMTAALNNLQLQTGGGSMVHEMPLQQQPRQMSLGAPLPQGVSEMPGERYPESIPELGTSSTQEMGSDETPTVQKTLEFLPRLQDDTGPVQYSPVDAAGVFDSPSQQYGPGFDANHAQYGASGLSTAPLPSVLRPGPPSEQPPQPQYDNKPYLNYQHSEQQQHEQQAYQPQQYYNVDDGSSNWPLGGEEYDEPQQQRGGLRVANASRASMDSEAETEWKQEAAMMMNFAGTGPDSIGRLD